MSLDLADIIAAYDAAYTAMHSNADSILMLQLVPFKKNCWECNVCATLQCCYNCKLQR